MVQIIQGQNVTISYLKENFALNKSEYEQFFQEWRENLPAITELEKQYLDRVKTEMLNVKKSLIKKAQNMLFLGK